MCNGSFSESGQPCGFVPCEAYQKTYDALASEKLRADKAEAENAALRQELDGLKMDLEINQQDNAQLELHVQNLRAVVEKADALAETIDHAHDLCASMDFLRERLEELRESISEPWRLHIDAYSAAVREMANRHEAVNELYECAEYTARMDMIKTSAKAYQEARHG